LFSSLAEENQGALMLDRGLWGLLALSNAFDPVFRKAGVKIKPFRMFGSELDRILKGVRY